MLGGEGFVLACLGLFGSLSPRFSSYYLTRKAGQDVCHASRLCKIKHTSLSLT